MGKIHYKWAIFNSYVKLPEDILGVFGGIVSRDSPWDHLDQSKIATKNVATSVKYVKSWLGLGGIIQKCNFSSWWIISEDHK